MKLLLDWSEYNFTRNLIFIKFIYSVIWKSVVLIKLLNRIKYFTIIKRDLTLNCWLPWIRRKDLCYERPKAECDGKREEKWKKRDRMKAAISIGFDVIGRVWCGKRRKRRWLLIRNWLYANIRPLNIVLAKHPAVINFRYLSPYRPINIVLHDCLHNYSNNNNINIILFPEWNKIRNFWIFKHVVVVFSFLWSTSNYIVPLL